MHRNKFVRYSGDYKAGDKIKKSEFIYVYTTVLELTYKISDKVFIIFLIYIPNYFALSKINPIYSGNKDAEVVVDTVKYIPYIIIS